MLQTQWKTVNEVRLEAQVSKLERALQRYHYENPRPWQTYEYKQACRPPAMVTIPKAIEIKTLPDDEGTRHLLGVSARVWTEKPFGLSYYVNPGLLTDTAITAQVLGLEHERFIRQLVEFVTKEQSNAGK